MDPMDRLEAEIELWDKLDMSVETFIREYKEAQTYEGKMTVIRQTFEFLYWLGWGDAFEALDAYPKSDPRNKEPED